MTARQKIEIRPFTTADVPAAGRLLAVRHEAHRRAEPLLSARYEEPAVAAAEIEAALGAGATGAVAVSDGELTGYLLGQSKESPVWGSNVWVESAGQAVTQAETVRDLYAVAAPVWVERGLDAHYALVPASDAALVDAWFRLGFGMQHVHGIREVPEPGRPDLPPGVVVRRAERVDIPVLAQLDLALPQHQALAPTYSAGDVPTLEEATASWEETFDAEGFAYFVAEHAGAVVGASVGCALEKSSSHTGLARPDRAGFLGFAAVLPEARGLGAGRALGDAVLAWTAESGFTSAVTDWRATNLLSSRTWPRLGFRPSFLRLHRRLGY
jgi:ribosomal protein S18 acetylase RimI-like enzyme